MVLWKGELSVKTGSKETMGDDGDENEKGRSLKSMDVIVKVYLNMAS